MKILSAFIILFYILVATAVLVVLIFLIIRRVNERDNETFEKRDN